MPGVEGRSGGRREGAGRKPAKRVQRGQQRLFFSPDGPGAAVATPTPEATTVTVEDARKKRKQDADDAARKAAAEARVAEQRRQQQQQQEERNRLEKREARELLQALEAANTLAGLGTVTGNSDLEGDDDEEEAYTSDDDDDDEDYDEIVDPEGPEGSRASSRCKPPPDSKLGQCLTSMKEKMLNNERKGSTQCWYPPETSAL